MTTSRDAKARGEREFGSTSVLRISPKMLGYGAVRRLSSEPDRACGRGPWAGCNLANRKMAYAVVEELEPR